MACWAMRFSELSAANKDCSSFRKGCKKHLWFPNVRNRHNCLLKCVSSVGTCLWHGHFRLSFKVTEKKGCFECRTHLVYSKHSQCGSADFQHFYKGNIKELKWAECIYISWDKTHYGFQDELQIHDRRTIWKLNAKAFSTYFLGQ